MALQEQNRMLKILHKNGVSRNHVKKIMDDLKNSGIFEEEVEECDDWESVDIKATIWFSDKDPQSKLEAIRDINVKAYENDLTQRRNRFFLDTEKRVNAKAKEMEERGLTGTKSEEVKPGQNITSSTRYGRSPLHEAIVMKNIHLVKKYVKDGLYLEILDNNGHTPMEMAYYEGYKDAMMVFDKYKSKK